MANGTLACSIAGFAMIASCVMAKAAPPRDRFGAIAYSPSTNVAGSATADDRQHAEGFAVADCRKNGGAADCRSLVSFRNGCGVLAVTRSGPLKTFTGSNGSEAVALREAKRACVGQRLGSQCNTLSILKQQCAKYVKFDTND
jgi:hypothetical protein